MMQLAGDAIMDQRLVLKDLAQLTRVSGSLFLREFQLRMGCAPYYYLLQQRIARARHLLAETDLQQRAVFAESGFSDQSHARVPASSTHHARRLAGICAHLKGSTSIATHQSLSLPFRQRLSANNPRREAAAAA